jgi:putative CocE/NonD family hydrolase
MFATAPPSASGSVAFKTHSRAAVFSWTVPEDTELTGPMAARLWVEADGTDDLNLFVGVEKWRNGRFVPFEGGFGYGRDRIATGWQQASLRRLDPEQSTPWEPVPLCVEREPLRPREVVAVDVALGSAATLFRAGEQLRLVVAGRWVSARNPRTGKVPLA